MRKSRADSLSPLCHEDDWDTIIPLNSCSKGPCRLRLHDPLKNQASCEETIEIGAQGAMEGPDSATHAREIARAPKALFEVVVEGMQESSLGRGDGGAWMDNHEG